MMRKAKTMMIAVGTMMAKMHHHQTIIFFCRRSRARKKNRKENLTLTMEAPRSEVIASVNFSDVMMYERKFGGGIIKPASTSCCVYIWDVSM